jgi:hypothetical protein
MSVRKIAARLRSPAALIAALVAAGVIGCCGTAAIAKSAGQDASPDDASSSAAVAEVRRAFTVRGKPIPPEIFRDFGDGDMADSGSIWVTVDLDAATGSNLYYDDITQDHGWLSQKKSNSNEVTGYQYIGSTANGLLVVLASWSGGGSGEFFTLHILDIAAANAFGDGDGKIYRRINLTILRSIPLGDRWEGDVTIAKNSIRIVTTKNGPADASARAPVTVEAKRP